MIGILARFDCLLLLHSQSARCILIVSPFAEKWSVVIGGFRFWALFLERPGNFKRRKSNIQSKSKEQKRVSQLRNQYIFFHGFTYSLIIFNSFILSATETTIFYVNCRDFQETGPRSGIQYNWQLSYIFNQSCYKNNFYPRMSITMQEWRANRSKNLHLYVLRKVERFWLHW